MRREPKARLRAGNRADATRVTLRPAGASTYEIVRRADGVVIGEGKCRADDPARGGLTVVGGDGGGGGRGVRVGGGAAGGGGGEGGALPGGSRCGGRAGAVLLAAAGLPAGAAGRGAGAAAERYDLDGAEGENPEPGTEDLDCGSAMDDLFRDIDEP